jgi:hypothetical protein
MYQLTEIQLRILMMLLTEKIKQRIASEEYPYGQPNQRGVGNKIASGQLYDSIDYSVEIDEQGTPMGILYYADYFKYVNRGRPPGLGPKAEDGGVPIPRLLEWINIKGINAVNEQGIQIPPLSLAFAIRQNIFRYGIRETNIYDKGLEDFENIFDDFPNRLPQDLRLEAEELFRQISEDINIFYEQRLKIELPTN